MLLIKQEISANFSSKTITKRKKFRVAQFRGKKKLTFDKMGMFKIT